MDSINYRYNGKSWKAGSTVSDKNSFFHAAFGVRADEDKPYLDKLVKFRRSRWVTLLNYFEDKVMPPRLAFILKNCFSANEKYKHVSVEDKDHFESYVWDIVKAEHHVTVEEIPILAALDNVKVVLFKAEDSEPAVFINPAMEFFGSYPHKEEPAKEVVLRMEGNIFSRMDPLIEDPVPTFTGNDKIANVAATKDNGIPAGSGLMKYKKGGNAGSEGVQFQVGLLTVFFLNALQKLKDWKLSTENTAAGKFDDVVLEWPDGATLLQAKHKQNKSKKITFEELVSVNPNSDNFSLPKYFLSYEQIKATFNLKEVIICTNASVDGKAMKFLKAQKVKPESLLHYENADCKFYTFTDEILPQLKENVKSYYEKNFQNKGVDESVITDKNIRDFLAHLQFFFNYPPGNDVGKVIEQLLFHMKLCDNSYVQISPVDIYAKMLGWFQQKDGVYITELYAKAIFSEIWRDKHWQKLEKYEIFFQCKDLNFQDSKRLFHLTVEGGTLLQEMKIFHTLQSNKTKILFFNPDDGAEKQKRVVEAFGLPQYTVLVLVWPKITEDHVIKEVSRKLREILDKFGYKKVVLVADCKNKIPQLIGLSNDKYDIINRSITLTDLSKDSQERLLEKENIVFQGNDISLKELLAMQANEDYVKFLNTGELEKLVRGEKIKVGAPLLELNEHISHYYIQRKFKRRDEIFPEDLICEMNEKVVLISDSAGTGKSTVLTNLATTMKKKYPHLWVIRIDLNNYTQILKDYLRNNKLSINILELLDSKHSTKLTNHLERTVFSTNAKVVLMLDGFDEISPEYTELLLSLLTFSREQQNFAKIIVTTRPHMAGELKNNLQVEPFLLEPFTEQNQNDFLAGYWMQNLDVDNAERGKCEEYAKALIKKISSWVQLFERGTNHFAAIPLHVRMLAEVFQENNQFEMSQDLEGCKEYISGDGVEPKLPENMKVTMLYKMFIEKKRSVFIDKGNPNGNTAANQALIEQFKECLAYHRRLALELFLDKKQSELFSCHRQTPENVEMNVLKIGIVQMVDNEFKFAHRTFAEYFFAQSLMEELKLPNKNVAFQKFLIEEILFKSQFNNIEVFFNNFLQQLIDNLPPNTFYKYPCVSYKITSFDANKFNLLNNVVRNGHLAIFQLILKCADLNSFKKIPGSPILFFETLAKEPTPEYSDILNIIQQEAYDKSTFTGITFLEHAVAGGHLEMVRFLVEQGANVNVGNLKPIHLALNYGHFEVAKFLVEQGADIRSKDSFYGTTVLQKAVSKNSIAMATYLLDKMLYSDDLNITDPTVPYTAAYCGRLDTLQKLLERDLAADGRTRYGQTMLFGAVRGVQLETIRYLVQQGYDINVRDLKNNTALHVVSLEPGLLSSAKLLVELGIDVNAKNLKLSTALHIAVEESNFGFVEFLVMRGKDLSLGDVEGNTPLHIAARNLLVGIVKFLVEYGANVNSKNNDGFTALCLAILHSPIHFENVHNQSVTNLVKFLIESGGDVNIRTRDESTVLHLAVQMGHLNVVLLLVESGVDVDIADNKGRTALHLAALKGYTHIVKFLVLRNASTNIRDNDSHTVLHYLVQFDSGDNDRCQVLRLVIENGGDVNIRCSNGRTALHLATSRGNLDVVILLIELGANINITDANGSTALHLAVQRGHFNIVKYLLKSGTDVTVRDNSGYTVLHLVAANKFKSNYRPLLWEADTDTSDRATWHFPFRRNVEGKDLDVKKIRDIMEIIVAECQKLIDIKDETGSTPLNLAALNGRLEIVQSLVKHGADVNNRNVDGYTALHTAICWGRVEIVKFLLIEWGVDLDIRDNNGCTALHLAVDKNELDIVVHLVAFGIDIDARDETGNTALHNAASKRLVKITEYLVEAGVDIKIRNNRGYTALHLAAEGKVWDTKSANSEGVSIKKGILDVLYPPDDILDVFKPREGKLEVFEPPEDMLDVFEPPSDDILDVFKPPEDTERSSTSFFDIGNIDCDLLDCFSDNSEELSTSLEFNLAIVNTLLARCKEAVDIKDHSGRTALHLAVLEGHLEVVKVLLKHNADVNIKDNNGQSALQLAIDGGTLDIVKLLVESGANINDHHSSIDWVIRREHNRTVLHLAAGKGELDTVVFFAELGIDVNVTDDRGYTALQLALDGGHLMIIKSFVEMGADVTEIENFESSVLRLAAESGDLDIMTFFAKRCANISASGNDGNTALHSAVRKNSLNMVKLLVVDLGIDLKIKNREGRTALHLASNRGCLDIANLLIEHGADLNLPDNRGCSALHLAVCCSLDLVTLLVRRGANIYLKNSNGDTPAMVAKKKSCIDVFDYLLYCELS